MNLAKKLWAVTVGYSGGCPANSGGYVFSTYVYKGVTS